MDDFFNNNENNPEIEKNSEPKDTADSSFVTQSSDAGVQASEPLPAENMSGTDNTPPPPPSSSSSTYPYSRPYGTYTPNQQYTQPRYGETNPYNQQPYNSPYQQQGSPYGNPVQPQPQQQWNEPMEQPQKPLNTKGNKVGKSIFIAIVCLCIVAGSVAIGFSVKDNKGGNNNASSNAADATNQAGDANGPSVTISSTPTKAGTATGTLSAAQIYEKVASINVGVLVYANNNLAGEGSGIIMGEDSTGKYTYIITCAHVISDYPNNVRIRFSDDTDTEAVLVGYDTKTDLGVLKVEKTGLTAAEFGDINALAVGQTVYAIGNPGGTEFFGSFTTGMISAMDRPVDSTIGYSQPCIQHTAAINPGNSGGALLNEYGQVIGINSSKIADTEYEGMGFAVPINTAKQVIDEIIAHGYVTNRPKLGISYSPISQSQIYSIIVQSNGLPAGSIIIREIDSESDINNKGVQINDLIIKANGEELTTTTTLPEIIEKMNVGDTITLTICRINNNYTINKPFDVKVKLVEDKGSKKVEATTTQPYFNPFGY